MGSVLHYHLSIYQNKLHPCRILMGLLEAGAVDDFLCIKDCHIGKVAFGNESTIVNTESSGRLTTHLFNGLFQCDDAALSDIVPENPGKGPILPWVGSAFTKHTDGPIGPNGASWICLLYTTDAADE